MRDPYSVSLGELLRDPYGTTEMRFHIQWLVAWVREQQERERQALAKQEMAKRDSENLDNQPKKRKQVIFFQL